MTDLHFHLSPHESRASQPFGGAGRGGRAGGRASAGLLVHNECVVGVHGGARGLTLTHTCVPLSSYAQYHTWMSGQRYAHRSLSRRFGRRRAGHIWAAGLEYGGSKGVGYRLHEVVVGGEGDEGSGPDVGMGGRGFSAGPRIIKWGVFKSRADISVP